MTTQKPELMPDEVYISLWKLSEDTALLSIQDESKTDAVKYHHDRVLQAACAERDALRALCEGMDAALGKAQTISAHMKSKRAWDINNITSIARAAYEKHKAGELC